MTQPPAMAVALLSKRDIAETAATLTRDAQCVLDIYSHDLDTRLFGSSAFAAAVRQFVLRGRRARVRVLVGNSTEALRHGARLVELGHRLSDYIEFRSVHPEHAGRPDSFLIADTRGMLHQPDYTIWQAAAHPDAPHRATTLAREFEEMWAQAELDPAFRRLAI